jgi:DNA-binding response OmpR family regulator
MSGTILVVENDQAYRKNVVQYLRRLQFTVIEAVDMEQGLHSLDEYPVDVVILEMGLGKDSTLTEAFSVNGKSGSSGYALIETIRSRKEYISIVVLTSLGEVIYEVAALQAGADDFLTKEAALEVLGARVKRCLRRVSRLSSESRAIEPGKREPEPHTTGSASVIRVGDLSLDEKQQLLRIGDGDYIHLSSREAQLLLLMARTPGKVFGKHELLETLWGSDATQTYDSVTSLIKSLRRKIEPKSGEPRYILSVHGRGYRFNLAKSRD